MDIITRSEVAYVRHNGTHFRRQYFPKTKRVFWSRTRQSDDNWHALCSVDADKLEALFQNLND